MTYVEVLVGDATFYGMELFTYSVDTLLLVGTLVFVLLRRKQVLGVVTGNVQKPPFTVKPAVAVPSLPPIPVPLISLLEWMRGYYPAPLGILTQLLLPKQLPKKPTALTPLTATPGPQLPPLSSEQSNALNTIKGPGTHILHGETGTGKTRVYIELTRRSLETGRSAIYLRGQLRKTGFDGGALKVHHSYPETARLTFLS